MIGLVMAGGKGSRMNLGNEKLLLKYRKPIILHVVDSLKNSNCDWHNKLSDSYSNCQTEFRSDFPI